jgi:DNA-binding transcriptional LysR family regulator
MRARAKAAGRPLKARLVVRGFDAIAQAVEAGPGVAEMPATTAEPLARLHAVDALAQESPAGDLP